MSNNKFVKMCDQTYLFKTVTSHTYTQAVRLLIRSANKTAVLPPQGTQITKPMCWMNQPKREHMEWAQTIYYGTMRVGKG
jgi:hypothetical protein